MTGDVCYFYRKNHLDHPGPLKKTLRFKPGVSESSDLGLKSVRFSLWRNGFDQGTETDHVLLSKEIATEDAYFR